MSDQLDDQPQVNLPQDDQPARPCRAEYAAARREMEEARQSGKTLNGVHLPLCDADGNYQPKQCLGSV